MSWNRLDEWLTAGENAVATRRRDAFVPVACLTERLDQPSQLLFADERVKVIQQKRDRLDEAFLFAQSIDATSYERQRDRLREELTLAQIDHHAEAVDEFDLQGVMAFAERVLRRVSDLWVQAPLD